MLDPHLFGRELAQAGRPLGGLCHNCIKPLMLTIMTIKKLHTISTS